MIAPADSDTRIEAQHRSVDHAVAVEGLTVRRARDQAVRNLSMYVPYGSIYALVGPNGSGKTTLLRTLATLERPEAGAARVDGIDIRSHPASVHARIGYLPDTFGVYASLTVREYLDYFAACYGLTRARRRQLTDEVLELVNLTDEQHRPAGALSRGLRQRLGIGRCVVHDPPVLLLDEPASGLDPAARVELLQILRELGTLGKTVLLTSHILPELEDICTHIGVMKAGRLVVEGALDELEVLGPATRLRLQVLDSGHRAKALHVLDVLAGWSAVELEGEDSLTALYTGSLEKLAATVRDLTVAGVGVVGLRPAQPALQELLADAARPEEGAE